MGIVSLGHANDVDPGYADLVGFDAMVAVYRGILGESRPDPEVLDFYMVMADTFLTRAEVAGEDVSDRRESLKRLRYR